jgi:superfamily II DNA or RNA helicase
VYPCSITSVEHVCIGDAAMLLAPRQYVGGTVRAMLDANDVQGALAELGGGAGEDLMTVVRRRIASDTEETGLQMRQIQIHIARLTGYARERMALQLARTEDRLERLRRDAASADARFADALASDCAICHSTLEHPVLVPCCQNLFCGVCMLSWMQARPGAPCPACRAENVRLVRIAAPEHAQAADQAEPVEQEAAQPEPRPELKTKAATILSIVNAARAGVLVYSTHVSGMYSIRNMLVEAGVSHSELQGRSTTRDKVLRKFRTGDVKVLFLNASENCAGIDLPGVSDIVLYHQMPESMHTQIVGRGRRICRTEPLAVHSLILAEDARRA